MINFNRKFIRAGAIGLAAAMMCSSAAYADELPGAAGVAAYGTLPEGAGESAAEQDDPAGTAGIAGWSFAEEETQAAYAADEMLEAAHEANGGDDAELPTDEELQEEEHASVLALEKRLRRYDSLYKNVVFPDLEDTSSYINIRSKASADSELVGKLYAKSAARVTETVDGEDGPWFKITSGSVTGYVKAYFFITGSTAEEMAKTNGNLVAQINTESLRLRKDASVESEQVALLSEDDRYPVVGEEGAFIKLQVDDDLSGYVLDDYVTLKVSYKYAISIEEEQAAIRRQREREEEAERARRRQEQEEDRGGNNGGGNGGGNNGGNNGGGNNGGGNGGSSSKPGSDAKPTSGSRTAICDYAESFVGAIPYVWGGTSLSSGVDCSGFVQQIFKRFGVSLPRTSGEQAGCGKSVSSSKMRPGDILYYGGHVAIYIGDGQIVHASNPETGIKISKWNYRTPVTIRNVLGD